MPELTHGGVRYEYAALVTSMQDEVRAIAQHYRDRGDSENNFDELKNQWAWAGFTTHDRKRCQMMARITALIYNWWTIFMRLGIPDKHAEAVSSRPLALHGIAWVRADQAGKSAALRLRILLRPQCCSARPPAARSGQCLRNRVRGESRLHGRYLGSRQ
jgi:hypothetical protein